MTANESLSLEKRALLKIRELKQELDAIRGVGSDFEPIAVVSMACRFPQRSTTPELFWDSLLEQTDQVSDIPESRWDLQAFHDDDPNAPGKMYARRGVFLDDLDLMDPEFFGISPREATWVDPQQRLLMEVGWEAMERAGWVPERVGDETGVFVGWMHNDYQNEASDSFLNLNPYIATGAAGSFLSGRLAYFLGLHGPSLAIDTACSSSLVALHLAIQSLQRGDCQRALVGGVNAICSPTTNILTCKLKALSPTGQSRAFDAAADGYLRGEGCGVVTLRRLSDAKASRDPILGVVLGSAIGHNGSSSGLTAPNPKAQEHVIRTAVERAQLQPEEIAYLEAHGTGTELGDPIEMRAAAAALKGHRTHQNPLLVGSVKTNIGHLEAAAGMAGLIKVLLSIQQGQLAGQLHFEDPNPHIPWEQLPVKVLTKVTDWPAGNRFAGVSAFGMSGTNAHVIVGPPPMAAKASPVGDKRPRLITLSAKSELALDQLVERHIAALGEHVGSDFAQYAFTTGVGRSHFEHRLAFVAESDREAIDKLRAFTRSRAAQGVWTKESRRRPRVAWQFTGQGSQYVGMAGLLYESDSTFRAIIDECSHRLKQLRPESDVSLLDVLFHDESSLHDTHWTQPAIFAVQMGLAKLLQSYSLQPDLVMGHSVGQYAAACVAGVMSWEDGLRLISERGRLIGQLPRGGVMAAAFQRLDSIESRIAGTAVSLAASNGSHQVISGPEFDVDKILNDLRSEKVRAKKLTTSHAFHSSLMDPVLQPFQAVANGISFSSSRIPLICNVNGRRIGADEVLTASYWANHIRQPVRYAESVEELNSAKCDVLLELGPTAILTRMAGAMWNGDSNALVSILDRKHDNIRSLNEALARLYVAGAEMDFRVIHGDYEGQPAVLPTYPFQRRRFWGPDKPRASARGTPYGSSSPRWRNLAGRRIGRAPIPILGGR